MKYTIKCIIGTYDGKKLDYKQHLIIRERPEVTDLESGTTPSNVMCDIPKCCGSCSLGKCELEAQLNKKSFYPNETAHANIKVNN